MPSASHPPTPPADGTSRGLVKGHRIALIPNDRQASLMAEHAGWARVASNWSIDRFAEGEDNEWLSDMDLRWLHGIDPATVEPVWVFASLLTTDLDGFRPELQSREQGLRSQW